MQLNHERSFFENRRNWALSELHGGSLFRTFNFNGGLRKRRTGYVCFELPTREASSFCDFWKLTSCDFIAFISSLIEVNFIFLDVLIKDKFTPNLCPNMNHFDAVDFSECYSEEVISFFLRSVYVKTKTVFLCSIKFTNLTINKVFWYI